MSNRNFEESVLQTVAAYFKKRKLKFRLNESPRCLMSGWGNEHYTDRMTITVQSDALVVMVKPDVEVGDSNKSQVQGFLAAANYPLLAGAWGMDPRDNEVVFTNTLLLDTEAAVPVSGKMLDRLIGLSMATVSRQGRILRSLTNGTITLEEAISQVSRRHQSPLEALSEACESPADSSPAEESNADKLEKLRRRVAALRAEMGR
jgi:hypothetical protein